MLRIVAVAAVVLLAACGAKEEAPAAETAVTADSTAMDSSAAKMDSTVADTAAKKM